MLIPAYFDGIGIGQVHYTSTNSFVCVSLTMIINHDIVFFKVFKLIIITKKLIITAYFMLFHISVLVLVLVNAYNNSTWYLKYR